MDEYLILGLFGQNLEMAFRLALPLAGMAAAIGLVASLAQTATSVYEPNLAFVPKLIGVAAVACAFGPGLFGQLVRLTVEILGDFTRFIL